MILYILITALVIGFLTFIHEFGHFFFARLFKVPVLEFAIGMGPKIYSWEGKQGTKYALRALPIGGFVQMEGEEGTSENPMAYNNLNPWKKIIVTAAGPIVNILFAVIVMFGIVATTPVLGSTVVGEFYDTSVSNSQLQIQDEIVKIGSASVHTYEELSYEIMMQGYEAVDVTVKRNGEKIVLEDVIFPAFQDEQSGTVLGTMDFKIYALSSIKKVTVFDYLEHAFFRSTNMVKMVFDSLIGMISGRFSLDAVSGPIGMVDTVGQMAEVSKNNNTLAPILNLVVLISMNLGIFNLLPIPALDGGRIVFHLIDGIAGKKVIKKEIEDNITIITMMLLLGFMLLISVKDVIKLF
jgi:regulator of sigma E protease